MYFLRLKHFILMYKWYISIYKWCSFRGSIVLKYSTDL